MVIGIRFSFLFDISRILGYSIVGDNDDEHSHWRQHAQYLNLLILTRIFLTTLVLIRIDNYATAVQKFAKVYLAPLSQYKSQSAAA